MTVENLAQEIINGRRLTKNDDLSFFTSCDIQELTFSADLIRQHFNGNKVDLCTIINGKSGKCSENCKFCAQSHHNSTDCNEYDFLEPEKILAEAKANEEEGVNRFAIVTAGRALNGADFDRALDTFRLLKEKLNINLCASMGLLKPEQFKMLKDAGVSRYHNNIETSPANFKNICTTHTFEDKIRAIKDAQAAGLTVCSGGIIGMGETFEDRIDMALALAELNIKSIPINCLTPIPGTPFENQKTLGPEEILRTVAMFRFINPEAHIRFAAGRNLLGNSGMDAFNSGASAAITGNMLTTTGTTIKGDLKMLSELGRDTTPDWK